MDQCFKLTGVYPNWFLNMKNKSTGVTATNKLAAHVGEIGNSTEFAGNTPLDLSGGGVNGSTTHTQVDSALVQAVYKEMMKMVKGQATSQAASDFNHSVDFAGIITASNANSLPFLHDKIAWIVDTGAKDHMIWDRSLFASHNLLHTPIKVGLPYGTVQLTDKIILKNVLLIPDCTHNLLSG